MEDKLMNVDEILKMMEKGLGEAPRPMVAMAKLLPEWIPKQAQGRQFVMEGLTHIPPKYKHLIMIAVAASVNSGHCAKTYIKLAHRAGVSKEEIAEAIITARFALGASVFAAATEGMEYLAEQAS